ncbi:MAG: branched-chain amino acid dehydrogenase, partial [Oscillospiraceae bacterium]|nr:branched-chain amino acid dehydrogenase [Oscillospiraceae bacterium]
MKKILTPRDAARLIPDGATLMVGGFMGCGSAHKTLAEIRAKELTVICNDGAKAGGPDGSDYYGVAKLIHNKQVKKLIASHVGLNPEVAEQQSAGTLELVLVPQGSLAEMIRAGGAGLGGV